MCFKRASPGSSEIVLRVNKLKFVSSQKNSDSLELQNSSPKQSRHNLFRPENFFCSVLNSRWIHPTSRLNQLQLFTPFLPFQFPHIHFSDSNFNIIILKLCRAHTFENHSTPSFRRYFPGFKNFMFERL